MALNMGDADYARSSLGKQKLKNAIVSDMKGILDYLNPDGEYLTKLKKTISNNWQGEDATDFLYDLNKDVKNIRQTVTRYQMTLLQAIEKDEQEFKSFQARNVK